MALKTQTVEFYDFISGLKNNLIKVPDYQRNYVWKTGGEIEEFWQDLEEQFKDLKKDNNKSGLFLGNIILCNPDESNTFQIVDGQQRITTIFILLIAFRSWLIKLKDRRDQGKQNISNVIDTINQCLIFKNKWDGSVSGYRFTAASSISLVFNHISHQDWDGDFPSKIKEKAVKRQSNKIKPIYDFFSKKIGDLLSNENDYAILNRTILDLTFIKITLTDFQEAYLFFERTNSRGKNLEVADLLKAHLFSSHPNSEDVVDYWDDIVETAGGNLTRMLKYFYISERGHITTSKLFKGLKDLYVTDKEGKEEAAETLLLNLDDFSRFFEAITKIENETVLVPVIRGLCSLDSEQKIPESPASLDRIYRAIDGLNLFGVTQATPLIWSFIKKYYSLGLYDGTNHRSHRKTLVNFFESLENYHFINNYILDRVGNEVEKVYARYANDFSNINNESEFTTLLRNLYKTLKDKLATKQEFISRFKEMEYSSANKGIYYILDRFNSFDLSDPKLTRIPRSDRIRIYFAHLPCSRTDMTIEHWYPQSKAKDQNKMVFSWCNNIGNLLALNQDTNNKLNDWSPQKKYEFFSEKSYFNSLIQNQYFFKQQIEEYGSFEGWGQDRIEKRSELLANEAYTKIWRFNPQTPPISN
jgi:uncharacterized protein with ParB-like and HNH nuclease domain